MILYMSQGRLAAYADMALFNMCWRMCCLLAANISDVRVSLHAERRFSYAVPRCEIAGLPLTNAEARAHWNSLRPLAQAFYAAAHLCPTRFF